MSNAENQAMLALMKTSSDGDPKNRSRSFDTVCHCCSTKMNDGGDGIALLVEASTKSHPSAFEAELVG